MPNRINHIHPQQPIPSQQVKKKPKASVDFKDILTSTKEQLTVSKHAKQRLNDREIHITEEQWQVIGGKVQEARKKGVHDSVVILNDAALLVSAKNNTVITALDREEASTRIFTNINGTILINE